PIMMPVEKKQTDNNKITRKEIEIFCFFRCFPFDMLIPFYPFLTIFHCNPQKEYLPLTILT
ncbi:hypothetical protein, partial [Enterococcus lactis]|uniref:hypothetical protein n=1 Tax=Enterococcus lactis TaxID=357441 RepID=UPI003DA4C982